MLSLTSSPSLITYTRIVDAVTTHSLCLPDAPQGVQTGQELCTLPDGRTVVALFAGFTLPANQPPAIQASIQTLVLTPEIKEQIKTLSQQVQLIYRNTEALIRSKYSLSDEAKYARIGIGALLGEYTMLPGEQEELIEFGAYCETARQWGRDERKKLGL